MEAIIMIIILLVIVAAFAGIISVMEFQDRQIITLQSQVDALYKYILYPDEFGVTSYHKDHEWTSTVDPDPIKVDFGDDGK